MARRPEREANPLSILTREEDRLEAERSFLDEGKEFLRKASVWKSDDITANIDEIFVGRNPDASIAAEHPALSVGGQLCHLIPFFPTLAQI